MALIKIIKKTSAVCFLLFSMSTVFAQKPTHPIDVKNKQCHENSIPTTSAALSCENNALIAWEKEMNTYLERLKKKSKQLDIVLLIKTQKKWKEFFNADIAVHSSYISKLYEGGTLSRVAIITYKKEEMKKRALNLKHFFENLE